MTFGRGKLTALLCSAPEAIQMLLYYCPLLCCALGLVYALRGARRRLADSLGGQVSSYPPVPTHRNGHDLVLPQLSQQHMYRSIRTPKHFCTFPPSQYLRLSAADVEYHCCSAEVRT